MSTNGPRGLLPEPSTIQRAAILCHMHADPDTYLSAYALRFLIQKYAPSAAVDIIVPEGMSVLTQRLAESFPPPREGQSPTEKSYDLLVAVDIGHTELLREWNQRLRASAGLKILIDHHPIQEGAPYDRFLVDTRASSAAELVYSLFKELNIKPDPDISQALLTGLLFDSQNLSIAGEGALRAVINLISEGAALDKARDSLRSRPEYGEVIAKLKAAKRIRIYRAAGWVIVVSTVGSFQANVARAFVNMGADVAMVAGSSDEGTRASMRSSHRFHSETKIHLGTDVAPVLSKPDGYGGGHPTAASLTRSDGEEGMVSDFLALMARLLAETPVEIK